MAEESCFLRKVDDEAFMFTPPPLFLFIESLLSRKGFYQTILYVTAP